MQHFVRDRRTAVLGTALAAGLAGASLLPAFAQDTQAPAAPATPAPAPAPQDGANLTAEAESLSDRTSQSRPASFAELAEKVSPSVVNITTSTNVARAAGEEGQQFPDGSPFEDFFRDFQDRNRDGQPRQSNALGSGFVISDDGFIVTNNHVIEGADEITVEFYAGFELDAEVVGVDTATDIAVLKVEPKDPLPFVEFGDSNASRVGDWVMAMGNPLGQGFSISAGIVSAKARALRGTYDDYIQTDAAINRGNSGGPLFNLDGQVIGVNTAILSPNGGSIGIGFAMSSAVVGNVVDQLREFGETRRGWLGVRIQDVTDDMVGALDGLETAQGAMVTDVPEGPAAEAGMESGDVILTFDGTPIEDTRQLVGVVGNTAVGKTVPVVVLRGGAEQTLQVTLARREEAETAIPASAEAPEKSSAEVLGMTVEPVSEEMAEATGAEAGLLVTAIDGESAAYDKGLREGDVITEAGQQKVATVDELEARVSEAEEAGRKSILMLIRREGDPRFVAVPLGAAEE